MMLVALAMEAGLPDGVLNVVHGTNVLSTSLEFLFFFGLHLYDIIMFKCVSLLVIWTLQLLLNIVC